MILSSFEDNFIPIRKYLSFDSDQLKKSLSFIKKKKINVYF